MSGVSYLSDRSKPFGRAGGHSDQSYRVKIQYPSGRSANLNTSLDGISGAEQRLKTLRDPAQICQIDAIVEIDVDERASSIGTF
jgi:hypothetical protein